MKAAKGTKPVRCALYARYSTEKQKETSIEDQYRECERVAKAAGFTIAARYEDKGISGGTAERPGYIAMLNDARQGKFDVIVTGDISRLWRNRAEFGSRSAELEDLGIHCVTCVGDDTRKDGWGLVIQIKQAMAEHYRREASYRTRRGLEGKARKGDSAGGRAYGYISASAAGGKRKVDPEQAKIVLQIYKWRAAGWSGQRIARKLNADGVPPPGAGWNRKNTGPRRKNTAGCWRASAIVGDPRRGVGILNNPLYKGQVVWGRSRWIRSAADSSVRRVEQIGDTAQWITTTDESLRIVPDDLWVRVHRIQTETNALRAAVRNGIAAKRTKGNGTKLRGAGRDSKYWLGTLLVCDVCGSNYIGDGRLDYVCPAHTAGHCGNNLRFRRDEAHKAMFDLLRRELLDPERMDRSRKVVEAELRAQLQAEEAAANAGEIGTAMRRLDAEAADLRKLKLRPAALAAGLAAIEQERQELQARAAGRRDGKAQRARQLLARMPELAERYRRLMGEAVKALAREDAVHDAREATRRLLADGCIRLAPNATGTAVTGPVHLRQLGEHVLEMAGMARRLGAKGGLGAEKLSGSGGRILHWKSLRTKDILLR